jgi:hypothetical protein
LDILERLGPNLTDLEYKEALRDLQQMGRVATGSNEKIP